MGVYKECKLSNELLGIESVIQRYRKVF